MLVLVGDTMNLSDKQGIQEGQFQILKYINLHHQQEFGFGEHYCMFHIGWR